MITLPISCPFYYVPSTFCPNSSRNNLRAKKIRKATEDEVMYGCWISLSLVAGGHQNLPLIQGTLFHILISKMNSSCQFIATDLYFCQIPSIEVSEKVLVSSIWLAKLITSRRRRRTFVKMSEKADTNTPAAMKTNTPPAYTELTEVTRRRGSVSPRTTKPHHKRRKDDPALAVHNRYTPLSRSKINNNAPAPADEVSDDGEMDDTSETNTTKISPIIFDPLDNLDAFLLEINHVIGGESYKHTTQRNGNIRVMWKKVDTFRELVR